MNTVAKLVMGIMLGILTSLVTLVMAQVGVNILMGVATVGKTLAIVTLLSGALLGVISVGLGYLTAGIERTVLVALIGTAIAALTVLVGGYGNSSILPVGIYGLVVTNSLLIARASSLLGDPAHQSNEPNLRS